MVIIDGPDAAGKTTLAKAIAHKQGAQYFHCGYNREWDMETYHRFILHTAGKMEAQANVPCIIDRWAMSEAAYGKVFRGRPSYPAQCLMNEALVAYKPTLIYCKPSNIADNFSRMKETRDEMYDSVEEVTAEFDKLLASGQWGTWIMYDYCVHDEEKFVDAFCK